MAYFNNYLRSIVMVIKVAPDIVRVLIFMGYHNVGVTAPALFAEVVSGLQYKRFAFSVLKRKEFIIWYDDCSLKYSNEHFLARSDTVNGIFVMNRTLPDHPLLLLS